MYLFILLICVCFGEGQLRLPLLSSLLAPRLRSSFIPSTPVFLRPPPPPRSSHRLDSSRSILRLDRSRPEIQPPFSPSPQVIEAPFQFQVASESIQHPRIIFRDNVIPGPQIQDIRPKSEIRDVKPKFESVTNSPFSSPTTIRFTLDDVPKFADPQFISSHQTEKIKDDLTLLVGSDGKGGNADSLRDLGFSTVSSQDIFSSEQPHLFLLTSTENEESALSPSTADISAGRSDLSFPAIGKIDDNFQPSLTFPFLEQSAKPSNSVSLIETKAPLITSLLHADPLQHPESDFNLFTLQPDKFDYEEEITTVAQEDQDFHLRETPVPKIVKFGEEDASEESEIERLTSSSSPQNSPSTLSSPSATSPSLPNQSLKISGRNPTSTVISASQLSSPIPTSATSSSIPTSPPSPSATSSSLPNQSLKIKQRKPTSTVISASQLSSPIPTSATSSSIPTSQPSLSATSPSLPNQTLKISQRKPTSTPISASQLSTSQSATSPSLPNQTLNFRQRKPTQNPPQLPNKTLNFNQDFLTLLQSLQAEKKNKTAESTEGKSFWLSGANEGKTIGAWRVKGGGRIPSSRTPAKKTTSDISKNRGGVFTTSLRALTASIASGSDIGIKGPSLFPGAPSLVSGSLVSGAPGLFAGGPVSGIPKLFSDSLVSEAPSFVSGASLVSEAPRLVSDSFVSEAPLVSEAPSVASDSLVSGATLVSETPSFVSGAPLVSEALSVVSDSFVSGASLVSESPSFVSGAPLVSEGPSFVSGAPLVSEGLSIISVGELGELAHKTKSPTNSPTASLKHGVQNLNVSAWVSGCPKLYGKVELKCEVNHDVTVNSAMIMRWKKKSFLKGKLEEVVVAEDDIVKVEDSRYSLKGDLGSYNLGIKDFRPKDCGTYECEARAADSVAASQLILFTCH